MHTLVLLRHGESTWNLANRFSGWTDVDLTESGRGQARTAGALLRDAGFEFDLAYTSVLKRAIRTLWIALDEMDRMWIPVHRDWRLNERHYGALQGLNKAQTAARYGEDQVLRWRRSYDEPPPSLEPGDFGQRTRSCFFRPTSRLARLTLGSPAGWVLGTDASHDYHIHRAGIRLTCLDWLAGG